MTSPQRSAAAGAGAEDPKPPPGQEEGAETSELSPPDQPTLWRKLLAETIGAFFLTLAAAAPAMTASTITDATKVAEAVAPGLVGMALIYALGDVSGAHFNPAVTMAFTCRRVFPWQLVPAYVVVQLAGATAAAALLHGLTGTTAAAGKSHTVVGDWPATVAEVVFTFLLVTVILNTAHRNRLIGTDAALAVGATIALCGLAGGELSGPSMNPARSLGPAIAAADGAHIAVYVVGPIVGALLAAGASFVLHPHRDEEAEQKAAIGDRRGA
jgi:aquaporin Z